MEDLNFKTVEELNTWLAGREEQPFEYDPETDGDFRAAVDHNGELLVECGTFLEDGTPDPEKPHRFRKYPITS